MCVEQDERPVDVQIKSTTKLADAIWPIVLNGLTDGGRTSSQLPPAKACSHIFEVIRQGYCLSMALIQAHPHTGMYQF